MASELQECINQVQRLADEAKDAWDPRAVQTKLIEAADKLRIAVTPPADRLFRLRAQNWDNVCARLVVEMGVLQAIAGRGEGNAVGVAEIARETGHDELLIVRLMRPLVNSKHRFFDEVGENTYAANAATTLFNSKGSVGGLKHFTDLLYPVAANVVSYVRERGTIDVFTNSREGQSPLKYAYGRPLFEYFLENAEAKRDFDWYMKGRRDATSHYWFQTYPAAQELGRSFQGDSKQDVAIVDVGGNQGHDLLALRKELPELPGRFILQDLPQTLNNLEDPHRFDGTNIEMMEHDFFTPQPVKGALAYYFHAIFHDWDDLRSQDILKQTAKVMTRGYSRILIDEWVLPSTGVNWRAAAADVTMLMYTGGMERTFKQWEALLDGAELKIVNVWGPPEKENVIEAMLK